MGAKRNGLRLEKKPGEARRNSPDGAHCQRTTERTAIATVGKRKPFDAELAEWSSRAERDIVEWLQYRGYDVTELPHGRHGVDHLAENAHERLYVEVERRTPKTWERGPFPYDSITIPERRNRYKETTVLVTVNRDITHGIIVFSYSLLQSRLAENRNRYVKSGELFYFVPYRECLPIEFPAVDTRTIAELNRTWKQEQWRACGRENVAGSWLRRRLLEYKPYGMTESEWRERLDEAERSIEKALGLR